MPKWTPKKNSGKFLPMDIQFIRTLLFHQTPKKQAKVKPSMLHPIWLLGWAKSHGQLNQENAITLTLNASRLHLKLTWWLHYATVERLFCLFFLLLSLFPVRALDIQSSRKDNSCILLPLAFIQFPVGPTDWLTDWLTHADFGSLGDLFASLPSQLLFFVYVASVYWSLCNSHVFRVLVLSVETQVEERETYKWASDS